MLNGINNFRENDTEAQKLLAILKGNCHSLGCPHVTTGQLIKNARAYQIEHVFIDGNVSTLWPRISIASVYKFYTR